MSNNLSIELSDQTFSVLSSEALAAGKSPAELAAAAVESIYAGGASVSSADAQAARARFESCFGSVDLGRPIGATNGARVASTGAELVAYWQQAGVVGSRADIDNSQQHARSLRAEAERRGRP